jgi:starch synthase
MSDALKILLVSPEVTPYARTGGLADVAGALPDALRAAGHDVRVMLPRYAAFDEGRYGLHAIGEPLPVPVDGQPAQATLFGVGEVGAERVLLLGHEGFFGREHLYGDSHGDYPDNDRRFIFLARAALEAAKRIDFRPDVIHCHDWQTGLIPVYLKTLYEGDPFFRNTASVFSIHNVGYQGLFPHESLRAADLPYDRVFHINGLEYYGKISFLKGGIVYADVVTTVSRRYAEEIRTVEFGYGMDGVLAARQDALFGVVNGADYATWDPAIDPYLPARYSPGDLAGKAECKRALLAELGLPADLADRPLLGFVGRLVEQKGLPILVEAIPRLAKKKLGLVVLGQGTAKYQDQLTALAATFGKSVGARIGFDDGLAHRIIAGSDFFIAPSRYEPCGLTQLYAMKYGTVPIVRATGGLDDTVAAWDAKAGTGTGFKFPDYSADGLIGAIETAMKAFKNAKQLAGLRANGMAADFSWTQSAARYVELYHTAMFRRP